jgi:DNA polymerase-3 subunit alpha
MSQLAPLVRAAAADRQTALAVTDHGNLGAAWKFTKLAKAAGVKPIIGIEAYLAHGSRLEHQTVLAADDEALGSGDEEAAAGRKQIKYHHLTVLAATKEGWRNLAILDAEAHAPEAFWSRPRMDMDLLAEHSSGLIALTGCIGGPVASPLAAGDPARAEGNLARLHDIFGDRLYVEVMDHGIPGERRVMGQLIELAKRHGIPVVATNDSHFVRPDESSAHDAWLCVGNKAHLDDPKRWRFHGEGYWLRTGAEMHALFDDQPGTEDAVSMTLAIAERIEDNVLPEKVTRLPSVGIDADKVLYRKVADGAVRRYGAQLPQQVRDRLRYEYDIITRAKLSDYFLIVEDMITWARANGIMVGAARGSAAGSAVAYCLGIVQVDPIKHGLLFERFLSPDRTGLPDIDTDFEQAGTAKVFEHLAARWGTDNVARIGTYNFALSQAALRLAGGVLDAAPLGAKLAATVPTGDGGKPYTFAELSEDNQATAPFRRAVAAAPECKDIVQLASYMEGQVNAESVHACGVVVSSEPLPGLVPMRRDSRDHSIRVSEWDGKDIEELGLVKLDVLGLRNLDIISAALRTIELTTGEQIDPYSLPEDMSDPRAAAAWRLIADGKTAGVFQLESSGMTKLAVQIGPQSLGELSDVIALFRPGPLHANMHTVYAERKAGKAPIDYGLFTNDPWEAEQIASVLGSTYGVPVYQEQLMRLGEVVAGFGPVNRDRLRKAVAKKLHDEMAAVGQLFVSGAQSDRDDAGNPRRPFSRATAEKVWDAIKGAGSYAFNASHSLGYAKLAYVTAFLKANWPAHFASAVLANTDDDDRRIATLHSVRSEGIEVRGPDVNLSQPRTTVEANSTVRLGLTEVKGVGDLVKAIVDEREQGGAFSSLIDLYERVKVPDKKGGPLKKLTVDKLEALVEAGAFDAFGPRLGQMMILHALDSGPAVPDAEWGPLERAARERKRLGVLLSTSPLVELSDDVQRWRAERNPQDTVVAAHRLASHQGKKASTIGVLASLKVIKKGARRAYITIEGSRGSVGGVIWGRELDGFEARGLPQVGDIVAVDGVVQRAVPRRGQADAEDDYYGTEDDEETPAEARLEAPPEDPEDQVEMVVNGLWAVPVSKARRINLAKQPVVPAAT